MNQRTWEDDVKLGLEMQFGVDNSEGPEAPVVIFSRKSKELSISRNGSQFLDYVNNC